MPVVFEVPDGKAPAPEKAGGPKRRVTRRSHHPDNTHVEGDHEVHTLETSRLNTILTFLSSRTLHFLEETYHDVGWWIGSSPIKSVLLGTLILITGLPGTFLLEGQSDFLWMKVDTRMYESFALTNHRMYKEYESLLDHRNNTYRPGRAEILIFEPKVAGTDVLGKEFLSEVLTTLNYVYDEITVTEDGVDYTFNDVCKKTVVVPPLTEGVCISKSRDPFSSIAHDPLLLDALEPLNGVSAANGYANALLGLQATFDYAYGDPNVQFSSNSNVTGTIRLAMASNVDLAAISGYLPNSLVETTTAAESATFVDSPGYTKWAPGILLVTITNTDYDRDADEYKIVRKWEDEALDYVKETSKNSPSMKIVYFFHSSVEVELAASVIAGIPFVFLTVGVMVGYAVLFLSTQTRVGTGTTTQIRMCTCGSGISGTAGMSALGWLHYFGWTMNILCVFVLFLVLCVGVDCTFIFVSAMKAVGPDEQDMRVAASKSVGEGGTAVTVTTATSIAAFVLAGATSTFMPGMMVFNFCMAIALALNFLAFVFLFSGLQVLNENRLMQGGGDLTPWKPATDAPVPKALDIGNPLREKINNGYVPLFYNPAFRIAGALVMLISLIISFAFIPKIGEGIPDTSYALDNSYLYPLYDRFEDNMDGNRPVVLTLLVQSLDLGSKERVENFYERVLAPPLARNDVLAADCLAADYYHYLQGGGEMEWDDWIIGGAECKAFYALNAWSAANPAPGCFFTSALQGGNGTECDVTQFGTFTDQVVNISTSLGVADATTAALSCYWTTPGYRNQPSQAPLRPLQHAHNMYPRFNMTLVEDESTGVYSIPSYSGGYKGAFSDYQIPKSFICEVYLLASVDDPDARKEQGKFFNNLTDAANELFRDDCYPCDPTNITYACYDFAMTYALDEEISGLVFGTIIYAISAVCFVLLFALPLHRAVVTALNILFIVLCILGFMGYAGFTYSTISFCTITMAIGFCVDYTVEVMHFSSMGSASDPMKKRMTNALKACGYDVLHGCITALIGVSLLSCVPGESYRTFGFLCIIMCLYGGGFALWCLPSVLIIADDLGGGKKDD